MKFTYRQNLIFVVVVSAILFLCEFPVKAERLPVKIYTSADGLGSSFVDYLMRDSRGFMWFCTRDGLSRFDGARFVTYQIGDKNSPPGIESIHETKDGMYWVMTTGGTYRFNPNDNSQPDVNSPRLNAEFITNRRGQFLEDSQGNIWMTTGGLALLKPIDGKFTVEKFNLNIPLNLNKNLIVVGIVESIDSSIWLNTNIGVFRLLPDKRIVYYPFEVQINTGNNSLISDRNGRIWLANSTQLFVIQPEPLSFFANPESFITRPTTPTTTFDLKPDEPYQLPQKEGEILEFNGLTVSAVLEKSSGKRIYQTLDGHIWITSENNLMQFANGTFYLHTDKEGLPNVMSRMEEDAAGNLWIGSRTGLARIDRHGLKTYRQGDGTNSSRFFAINQSFDGTLYFATRDFHINRFDNEKFESIRPLIPLKSDVLWTSRFTFLDSKNNWWVLSSDKLYYFADISKFEELKNKPPTKVYSTANGLKSNGIFQIFESSNGDIWVSTRDETAGEGTGIARLKKGEDNFYAFRETDGLPKSKSFSSAVEDADGNLWFCFYNGGFARFINGKFEIWGENDNLGSGVFPDLHIDKKGRLWIGSAINGLFRLDNLKEKNTNFIRFTTDNGLSSNNIRTIAEDNFGRIYVGTARGVDRLSPETGQVKHYSVNDGLASDFVVDSFCDKSGNLWFATFDGLSRLTPLPDEKSSPPRIFLGGLRIAGEPQAVAQLGSSVIEKGELSASQNNLQIDFFGLDFRAGETLRYQYKFENVDADWSVPTEQRTVNFANLSPGNYRFLVRAVNSEGLISENPAIVSFKILSPIYVRWWFISLCVLLISAIIFAFYRYRLARLREINLALEEAKKAEEELSNSRAERLAELEKVRSRIATDLHDDIGASLTQIAILSEVAQAQSKGNGASDSLQKITNVSNELVGTMSDIVWSINPSKDHLSDLTQRMRRFASDSLSAKGIIFQFHLAESNQEIIIKSHLRREVFLIFKESINNIVKHSQAGRVEIKLETSVQDLNLTITDDGTGFESEKAYENSLSSISMGKNGILSMKKRAEEMGGELRIESGNGQGTTVKLHLPMDLSRIHQTEV